MIKTRYYICEHLKDWRNYALFSFDLAMLIRGFVLCIDKSDQRDNILNILIDEILCNMDGNHCLSAHRLIESTKDLIPIKWSTCPGPFLVKASAAIWLCKNEISNQTVLMVCQNTCLKYKNTKIKIKNDNDWHPMLYYLEGLLLYGLVVDDRSFLEKVAADYTCMLQLFLKNNSTCTRSDIIAQFLRIGCALSSIEYIDQLHFSPFFKQLYEILVEFISHEGAVYFTMDKNRKGRHKNTWCTIFAYQALCFYACLLNQNRFPESWLWLLI